MKGKKSRIQGDKVKMPLRKTLSHNWFMIQIVFSASPFYGIMLILDSLRLQGLNFVEMTFAVSFVLEAVEFGKSFQSVLYFILFMCGLLVFSGLFSSVFYSLVSPTCLPKIEKELKTRLYKKARDLDLSCYDDPYYYNEFVLAVSESKKSLDRTIELIRMVFTGLIMFFTYGTYFLIKDPISVIFVLISFFGRFFLASIVNKLQFQANIKENPLVRKGSYVHRVFYLSDYAKELRLNKKATQGLYRDFEHTYDEVAQIRKGVAKKKWGLYFLIDYMFSGFITDVLYLTYLVWRVVVRNAISFSTLVVLYNSAGSLRRSMGTLSNLFPHAMETALYVEKIRTFLEYETKIVSHKNKPALKSPSEIRFDDVSFAYSESGERVLSHVNLTIRPKEKIALVGYNGAGKTTLIKLLMRLYDPTEGRITLDGVDIKDYNVEEYRERIGTIFQDYRIYAATVEENITMDLSPFHLNEDHVGLENASSEASFLKEHEIRRDLALKHSGFLHKLNELDQGVETQLTREFDESGTNLSGGESQKLATARVFYKESDMIILDEPSSALDPIAEYQLNHSMMKAANDKSVIFISHRLSTTRHADKIFMLEKGRVIEEGTHDQLIEKKGKYSEMWEAQASRYT